MADSQQHNKSENNSLHVVLIWRFFTQVSAQRDEEGGRVEKTHTDQHDPGRDTMDKSYLSEPDELCCDNVLLMVPFIQSCYTIFAP